MALADQPLTALPAAPRPVPARSIRRRKRLERLTYGAATLGLALGPHTDLWPAHLGTAALGTLTSWWLWRKCLFLNRFPLVTGLRRIEAVSIAVRFGVDGRR
ncbi:hypothetical protein ACH4K4_37220, partial [Streptomyces sp. NPDC017529]